MTKKQIGFGLGPGSGTWEEGDHFWGDGNVLCRDCDEGYTQDSLSSASDCVIICKLYFSNTDLQARMWCDLEPRCGQDSQINTCVFLFVFYLKIF